MRIRNPFPWSRKANQIAADQGQEIARQAVLEVLPEIMAEVKRQIPGNFNLDAQVPQSYPQKGGSPYPLYGYDRPTWYATPVNPRRRVDSLLDVDTIRRFADTYDIARSCINHLKREVQAQKFHIVSKDLKDNSEATLKRIREAHDFFTKDGGLGEQNEGRREYESKLFEDVLVLGCFASWKNWTKGGKLMQVLCIDAATIRPRMDAYGWPGPGEDWYEQWIMGMLVTGFEPHELVYNGLWPITWTPWFRSPIEYLIATTLSALKADEWNRAWLTDGNVPGQTISLPEEWTPQQMAEYMDYFNSLLAGDAKARQKAVGIPSGTVMQEHSRKDQDFAEFEMWLARRTGAIYGVQLASIGFAGEQYKVSQENSSDSTTQFGAGALLDLRKEHYDDILQCLGFDDLEVKNGETAEEAPAARDARLYQSTGGVGWLTINDARKEAGLEPIPGCDVVLVPNTVQPFERVLEDPEPEPTSENGKQAANLDKPAADFKRAELGLWEKKAVKRIKEGRSAACSFVSDALAQPTIQRIVGALESCKTAADVKALFRAEMQEDEDDSEDEGQVKKKRKRLWVLLKVQLESAEKSLREAVEGLKASTTGATSFVSDALAHLTKVHTEAAVLGRVRAGIGSLETTAADVAIGKANAQAQIEYLSKLATQIQLEQLSDDQIEQRLKAFAQRVVGTANQAWIKALPQDASLMWNDTGDADECEDCPKLAAGSPYTPETIPTMPGLGQTQCHVNCRCFVTTEDGHTSFYDPEDE